MCGATLPSNITPLHRIDSKKGIIYILLTVLVLSTKHPSPFNVKNAKKTQLVALHAPVSS